MNKLFYVVGTYDKYMYKKTTNNNIFGIHERKNVILQ